MIFERLFFSNLLKRATKFKVQKTFASGALMALVDMVPGISGSTIALVLGFYHKLLFSIKNIEFKALVKLDLKTFLKSFDYIFLIPLILGMVFSFLLFSKLFNFLLFHEHTRGLFLSFFLGAVLSCMFNLLKEIKISLDKIVLMLIGAAFSFVIAYFSSTECALSYLFTKLVVSGFIAIFAMLLPGISGSLILILFGVYPFVINALANISNFENFKILAFLSLGIFMGLLIFPRIILFFLEKYYFLVLSFLTGLMLGSIYALWPFYSYTKTVFANNTFLISQKFKIPDFFSYEWIYSIAFISLGFFIFFKIQQLSTKKT